MDQHKLVYTFKFLLVEQIDNTFYNNACVILSVELLEIIPVNIDFVVLI